MKRALCIGINEYVDSPLNGCVNDALDWVVELSARGFRCKTLLDRDATKAGMVKGFQDLVCVSQPGDLIVITYSGHGSWVPDLDGDELDQRDECLCPYDIGSGNYITDDEIWEILNQARKNVRFIFLSDSCHSGTILRFLPGHEEREVTSKVRFLPPTSFLPDARFARSSFIELRTVQQPKAKLNLGVLISGCMDREYSYDAEFNNRPNGAFTYFAIKALRELGSGATYKDWHRKIRAYLPDPSHPQSPNLMGSKKQVAWKLFEEEAIEEAPSPSFCGTNRETMSQMSSLERGGFMERAEFMAPIARDHGWTRVEIFAYLFALLHSTPGILEFIQHMMEDLRKFPDLLPPWPVHEKGEMDQHERFLEAKLVDLIMSNRPKGAKAISKAEAKGLISDILSFIMANPQILMLLLSLFGGK